MADVRAAVRRGGQRRGRRSLTSTRASLSARARYPADLPVRGDRSTSGARTSLRRCRKRPDRGAPRPARADHAGPGAGRRRRLLHPGRGRGSLRHAHPAGRRPAPRSMRSWRAQLPDLSLDALTAAISLGLLRGPASRDAERDTRRSRGRGAGMAHHWQSPGASASPAPDLRPTREPPPCPRTSTPAPTPRGSTSSRWCSPSPTPPVSECPECGAPVRKVYGSVGVVFKGSGFYRTDSRKTASASETASSNGSSSDGKAARRKAARRLPRAPAVAPRAAGPRPPTDAGVRPQPAAPVHTCRLRPPRAPARRRQARRHAALPPSPLPRCTPPAGRPPRCSPLARPGARAAAGRLRPPPRGRPADAAVAVAATDLPAGTVARAGPDLAVARLPPELVPRRGRRGARRSWWAGCWPARVRAGEPVTDVRLVGAGLTALLPDGQVAAPVRLADLAVAALVRTGDRVDVLATAPDAGSRRGGGRRRAGAGRPGGAPTTGTPPPGCSCSPSTATRPPGWPRRRPPPR